MSRDRPPPSLGRFVRAGKEHGQALRRRDPLASSASSTIRQDAERSLEEARAFAARDTLISRESALSTLRGLERLPVEDPRVDALRTAADDLRRQLLERDEQEFAALRAQLRDGRYTPDDWRADLRTRPAAEGEAFTARLLSLQAPPPPSRPREDDMVHFVASPIDAVLEVAAMVSAQDVFYDVGCGTGRVALLVRWLTGATTKGIEYDGAYVTEARRAQGALGLDVTFIEGDARDFDYADATVLYAFEPFRGAVMAGFLDRLRAKTTPFTLLSRFVIVDGAKDVPWLTLVDARPSGLRRYVSGERA